mmetsp:Transcript_27652/g.59054  ORF Transcript_27652/g.59054 Transcript_27652/m.59054 type:complete len:303 (+) Transcript_27652:2466-3374(+)
MLEGTIPSEIGQLEDALVILNGNENLSIPAPLSLCFVSGFDLKDDAKLCPIERNALKELHILTKGQEWTNGANWTNEYSSYCFWQGVTCDAANRTTVLNLTNNGLSGKLSESIRNLTSLEVLDLSDNDIKGAIPTEIGLLSHLHRLRLNHNSFVGDKTNFGNLKSLELIQLHGNRLSGTIPTLNLEFPNSSSYIADCGSPSDFDESLNCEECTMCCNAQGDCYPQEESNIQKVGFDTYMQFAGVFFACLIGASCALVLAVSTYDKYRNCNLPSSSIHQPSLTDRDKKYALDAWGFDQSINFS